MQTGSRCAVMLSVVFAAACDQGPTQFAQPSHHLAATLTPGAMQAHGSLQSQPLFEGCSSPIGFCTVGTARGVLNGEFVFTARRSVLSDTPGVVLFTGEIIFKTGRGEVRCQDAGAYNMGELESGPGPFASLCTITAGTGDWADATGHIRIQGTFSLAQGGNSRYEGLITR